MVASDDHKRELRTQGFSILKDVFTVEEVQLMKEQFVRCESDVHRTCRENPADPYDFIQLFDREKVIKMQSYCEESIIETAKGRYDVRTQIVKDTFASVPKHPRIANLMKTCLKERYLCDIGILVTSSHSNDGPWHRDTYNLNGPSNPDGSYDDSTVMQLNPFYYTVLVALDDVTEENGRTEFIVGSHKLTYDQAKDNERMKNDLPAGSAIAFDGRMFHRACAHPSNHARQMIYLVFHRDWYVDV